MTRSSPFRVLFLSTHNAARSILAEYLLRRLAPGRFEPRSAGLEPRGEVHPLTLKVLRERFRIDPAGARSKPWEEFQGAHFDLIITVCDKAREVGLSWPATIVAHWNEPDPVPFEGDARAHELRFVQVGRELSQRLDLLCALPQAKLENLAL